MRRACSTELLDAARAGIDGVAEFSIDTAAAAVALVQGYTVVDVPIRNGASRRVVRVALHPDLTVAGFFVHALPPT